MLSEVSSVAPSTPTARPVHSAPAVAPVLDVVDVSMNFGGVRALTSTNLQVKPNTITSLIGPNGAGKTTLFNIISGLLSPTDGLVYFKGRNITGKSVTRRSRLGLARTFQKLEAFNSLSARDNIRVAAEMRRRRDYSFRSRRSQDQRLQDQRLQDQPLQEQHLQDQRLQNRRPRDLRPQTENSSELPVKESLAESSGARQTYPDLLPSNTLTQQLLELTGLQDVADITVGTLPTGTARIVELARALAIQPSLLLLDEPSSGLNEEETGIVAALLQRLVAEQNLAVLLVEHDMSLVMDISMEIYVLDFGQIIAQGSPMEIQNDRRVQVAYLGEN